MDYVSQQLTAMFERLSSGKDVPPARVYRLEGYMQALIQTGVCSRQQLIELMASCYNEVYQASMPDLFPPSDDESLIAIPVVMARAPVK